MIEFYEQHHYLILLTSMALGWSGVVCFYLSDDSLKDLFAEDLVHKRSLAWWLLGVLLSIASTAMAVWWLMV